jgi:hypothetical protein
MSASHHLNEHDANQGAQSSGEFLGMTGNSGWYLLGSGGMTILMVILLWGILGLSLLLCLLIGIVLCALSITYVFTLKNNKPEHYDTDFFESALIEAGVCELRFGPQARRLANPFTGMTPPEAVVTIRPFARSPFKAEAHRGSRPTPSLSSAPAAAAAPVELASAEAPGVAAKKAPVVARETHEELRERLRAVEEQLEDALTEGAEA